MKKYIIIYNDGVGDSFLHSDGKYYYAFINIKGCYVKIYKRHSSALKMVNALNKKYNCERFFVGELPIKVAY